MSKLKREQKKAENKNRIDGMKGTNTAAGTLRVLGMPLRLYLLVFLLTLACMIFGCIPKGLGRNWMYCAVSLCCTLFCDNTAFIGFFCPDGVR